MTATTTKKKPERFTRVVRLTGGRLLLTLEIGRDADAYLLDEFVADWGRAFTVLNLSNGEKYEVNVCPKACTCKGFLRWGHCKHSDALAALHEAGRLPAPDEIG